MDIKIIKLVGIGERCFISHAIVDKNCRIGNDVYINGGKHLDDVSDDLYAIKDGIVVIKKALYYRTIYN
jgi:glucose-1-phosphate adenylyltransferase